MPINILMPALSPTMEKGNLAKWLKKEGDKVKSGDVIAEIETDKATMEVEAVDEGTIAKILVPEGTQDVPVNDVIAIMAGDGAEPSSGETQNLRILSVEDNPFGRVVLNAILTELGHNAEFIGRGEAAAERIAEGAFDAVLMDMVLPGIDGIEAIRRIRALQAPLGRIAIIGVSGRGDDEAASRTAGADAFLVKPVSPRALATALLEATRRAAAAT